MAINRREFLFLQGPPGPFFWELARALEDRGVRSHRINLSGGDRYDWPVPASDYRGRMRYWPLFFDNFARTHDITDLVLFGDCRPVHQAALRMAQLRGIHIHVFEEGYIRPDWMTLERDGVNGHSPMERDPVLIMASAQWLPPVPKVPTITAHFGRRVRDNYWHYHHVVTGKLRFPFYRTHRQGSIVMDGIGWILKFQRKPRRKRMAEQVLSATSGRDYFLFPLQLAGDYQIRAHSPFGSMLVAVQYVLESFARCAPADAVLIAKEHPLDSGYLNWQRTILRIARTLGVEDRVFHIDGGDLESLAKNTTGVVCVNSTSATLALEIGVPVIALGDAIYSMHGITNQRGLDNFWADPVRPDPEVWDSFKRNLHAKCLVHGGLASQTGMEILVRGSVERLLAEAGPTDLQPHNRRGSKDELLQLTDFVSL